MFRHLVNAYVHVTCASPAAWVQDKESYNMAAASSSERLLESLIDTLKLCVEQMKGSL